MVFVFRFHWSFINREHSPSSQLPLRSTETLWALLHRSSECLIIKPYQPNWYGLIMWLIQRIKLLTQRIPPPSLPRLALHHFSRLLSIWASSVSWQCHLGLSSGLMKWMSEERSASLLDYYSVCLANKLKQDIALISGPSVSFIYKHNKLSTAHCLLCLKSLTLDPVGNVDACVLLSKQLILDITCSVLIESMELFIKCKT